MAGSPLKNLFPDGVCLAYARTSGKPCRIRLAVFKCKNGKFRCRFHGGLSTGPKTKEGRERSGLPLKRWHEKRRALKEEALAALVAGLKGKT